MGADHADVAAHDLHAGKSAGEGAVVIEHEALGAHGGVHGLVGQAGGGQHGFLADEQPAALDAAGEHVDGRRAQELCDEQVVRVVIDGLRFVDLLHDAGLHYDDDVGDAHGLVLVVRDEHRGDARLALDAADLLAGLQAQAGVEVGQRLVQQQHAGHLDQRAGDGDALLLPARQLAGLAVEQLADLHEVCGLPGAAQHLVLGGALLAAQVLQRKEYVLQHRQVRIERVVLEHQPHAALLGGQGGDVVLAKVDLAGGGLEQAAQQVERGGLAAARRPEQAHELAVGYLKGEVVHRDDLLLRIFAPAGEFLGQILQNDFHAIPSLVSDKLPCAAVCAVNPHFSPSIWTSQRKKSCACAVRVSHKKQGAAQFALPPDGLLFFADDDVLYLSLCVIVEDDLSIARLVKTPDVSPKPGEKAVGLTPGSVHLLIGKAG